MAMYVIDDSFRGDLLERKGSLYLRSNHMHYDKPTKVSGWHQSREAEPKDYDITEAPLGQKNLCHSTYRRFGNVTSEVLYNYLQSELDSPYQYALSLCISRVEDCWNEQLSGRDDTIRCCILFGPGAGQKVIQRLHRKDLDSKDWNTTTEHQLSQIYHKGDYEVRDVCKQMVNEDNLNTLNCERQTGLPDSGFGAVLPHHSKDHNKMHLDTTYGVDYMTPLKYTTSPVCISKQNMDKVPEVPDYSSAFKKCHSQFTDTADYRRHGRNTWQDESGFYANREVKFKVFKPTCPITPHL